MQLAHGLSSNVVCENECALLLHVRTSGYKCGNWIMLDKLNWAVEWKRVLMNEAVGKYSLSLLCLESHSTQEHFPTAALPTGGKKPLCVFVQRRVSEYVCMCDFVCSWLDRQFPEPGLFSIMFYVSLLLNQSGAWAVFAKYCCSSAIMILEAVHYLQFIKMELLAGETDLRLLRPQWQWHMLSLHKYIITCYTCRPLHYLAGPAERSNRRGASMTVPRGRF